MGYFNNYDKHVHLIYETILDPGKWKNVIHTIATDINAESGVVGIDNLKDQASITLINHGFDQSSLDAYLEYFHEKDIWNLKLMALPKNQFYNSEGQVSQRTYLESELYQDWGRLIGVRHAIGAYISNQDNVGLRVAFQRNSAQGEFDSDAMTYLNSLVLHMQRAAQLGYHLNCDMVLNDAAMGIFKYSGMGVVLLNQHAEAILVNSVADSWLNKGLFQLRGKRLVLQSGMAGLKAVVKDLQAGRLVHVPTQYVETLNGERIAMDFAPFTPSNSLFSSLTHKAVLVLLRDAGPNLERQITSFSVEHQLTQTETNILRLMVKGMGPEKIAEARSRSLTTIRTQIRAILEKANCRKSSELIAQFT